MSHDNAVVVYEGRKDFHNNGGRSLRREFKFNFKLLRSSTLSRAFKFKFVLSATI